MLEKTAEFVIIEWDGRGYGYRITRLENDNTAILL